MKIENCSNVSLVNCTISSESSTILTKAAEEEYSNLPRYLINCAEAKPPADSERNKAKQTCYVHYQQVSKINFPAQKKGTWEWIGAQRHRPVAGEWMVWSKLMRTGLGPSQYL